MRDLRWGNPGARHVRDESGNALGNCRAASVDAVDGDGDTREAVWRQGWC